jgi:hypothetical protein
VRDVGRVELGAQSYGSFGRVGGKPRALVGIVPASRANALQVSQGVQAAMARLAPSFPSGVAHTRPYNTTEFVPCLDRGGRADPPHRHRPRVLTVYVFLQDWRATLIPTLTIPVSLVGTFAVISAFGFSINTLTLFGLVLAIGIVVDDAIVVVENTQRHLDEESLRRVEATRARHRRGRGPGHRDRARAHGGVHPISLPARHHRPALPAVRADHRGVGGAVRAQRAYAHAGASARCSCAPPRGRQRWLARGVERGLRPADRRVRPHRRPDRPPRRTGVILLLVLGP